MLTERGTEYTPRQSTLSVLSWRIPPKGESFGSAAQSNASAVKPFPIVCLGGETLDLDVFIKVVRNLPADLGAAIVVIDHIEGLAEKLIETLPQHTEIPVQMITDKLPVKPNRIFVLHRGHDLHVLDGLFQLKPVSKPTGWSDVITVFLRSLTQLWSGQIVAVILSGLDGDGAPALCALQSIGGATIVQKPDAAENQDMPATAIATGCVDSVLPVENIAREIVLRVMQGVKAEVTAQ